MILSILIAAYNVEKYIEKCVTSCANQKIDTSLYEIIVVNDGSTDTTGKICNKLATKIKNLKVVYQENMGLGACRNKGLKHSKGEFVWFIDGDDYLEENVLQEIVSEIEKKKLDVLVLDYAVVNANYEITDTNLNKLVGVNEITNGPEFYYNNYNKSYTWLFVFKRNLFLNNSVQFKEKINMQDSEILPKLLINTHRIAFFNKVCYYYAQQDNSYTNSSKGDKRYKYFVSIIEVRDSLQEFSKQKAKSNENIVQGIEKKLEELHNVVFMHLIFFKYDREWLLKIIKLLKNNNFFPVKAKVNGKMKYIKYGMNMNPLIMKKLIDFIRSSK